MRPRFPRIDGHQAWIAPVLVLSLTLLTACAPRVGGSAASPAPAERTPIRIGYLSVLDDAPAMLAQEAGLYDKHGLKAELQAFASGTDLIKAIVGGQLDAGVLGFTNAITWASQGADLKVVGGAQMGYHSLLVRKGAGIKTLADLRGRRLATQQRGSTADIVLNGVVLPSAGLKRQDVQLLYVSPSVAIESLAAGRVDAAFVFEPYDRMARLTASVTPIYEIGKAWPFPCMVVIASGKTLKSNRNAVDRLLAAQKEAILTLREQPDEAARLLAPRFLPAGVVQSSDGPVPAASVVADAIRSQTFDWRINEEQVKRMQEIADMMVQQGVLAKPVDVGLFLDLSWQGGDGA